MVKKNYFGAPAAGKVFTNRINISFAGIPAGKLAATTEEQHGVAHPEVSFSYSFWMGQYELTRRQFFEVMGDDAPESENLKNIQPGGRHLPIRTLHQIRALWFADKLTQIERDKGTLPQNWRYDLPTAEEWRYAAHAGNAEPLYGEFVDIASPQIYGGNDANLHELVQGGLKRPNAWGLYDMVGNLGEITWIDRFKRPLGSTRDCGTEPTSVDLISEGTISPKSFHGLRLAIVPETSRPFDLRNLAVQLLIREKTQRGAEEKLQQRLEASVSEDEKSALRLLFSLRTFQKNDQRNGEDPFPEGTFSIPGDPSRYMVIPVNLTLMEAYYLAREIGGRLVLGEKLRSPEFSMALKEHAPDSPPLWIGLLKFSRDDWKWIDGSELSSFPEFAGETGSRFGSPGGDLDGVLRGADQFFRAAPETIHPALIEWPNLEVAEDSEDPAVKAAASSITRRLFDPDRERKTVTLTFDESVPVSGECTSWSNTRSFAAALRTTSGLYMLDDVSIKSRRYSFEFQPPDTALHYPVTDSIEVIVFNYSKDYQEKFESLSPVASRNEEDLEWFFDNVNIVGRHHFSLNYLGNN